MPNLVNLKSKDARGNVMTYRLRYGFGEEMVAAAIGPCPGSESGPAPFGLAMASQTTPRNPLDRFRGSLGMENWGEK
ncbi:hypothetical protein C1H46_002087 [Malus baccata]|uniref:Uncharacterized protein n=1 Tax=Malus baccata TaxID=106549 RepID=A0A540NN28_MALBA|nr:hypothetical protein C1H46_002087 [Malus baccata]